MNITFPSHQEICRAFNRFGVKYLLVGGYAVIHYGYERTTGDMDLWIEPTNDIEPLEQAFRSLHYEEEDIDQLGLLDFTRPTVFSVGQAPEKVDFLTKISLVSFDEAYEQRKMVHMEEDLMIPVIQYRHLILSKMNTGRLKDKADIEELQKINKHRKKP